ncbi:MAG: Uncharacterised protein [Hyphomonas sp. TMED17]|nr:MAG: Uncharacterised protein [Hyphomonas sp. TMED17]
MTEPVVIIHDDGISRPVAKLQKWFERRFDAFYIGIDFVFRKNWARFLFVRRIADFRRSAAH